jgi:phage-related baseplate assembly protein
MPQSQSQAQYIDLSRLPAPEIIEQLNYEDYVARYKADLLSKNSALAAALNLEQSPTNLILEAQAYGELIVRGRINAAVRAVLAPLAKGTDLDNVVARVNIQRLVVTPASGTTAAVYETDDQLLRRYLLAFDQPSAGSADRYRFEAYTTLTTLQDVAINGRAVHGRNGDVDVVVAGPNGDAITTTQLKAIRDACTATDVKPEATNLTVVQATRRTYSVNVNLLVPKGPDPALVASDAQTKIQAAISNRLLIGAEVPLWALAGAAYGPNIIRVTPTSPNADIPADPYTIPVCTGLTITTTVAT